MSRENCFESRCPIVARERGPFARIINAAGEGPPYIMQKVTFETEVLWLRQSSTSLRLVNGLNNITVQEGSGYADVYYGFLTSIGYPFDEAENMAHDYGVTPDGALIVEVIVNVIEKPVILTSEKAVIGHSVYRNVPNDWMRDGPMVDQFLDLVIKSDPARFDIDRPTLSERPVLSKPIWSSRNGLTNQDQFAMLNSVIEEALVGVDADIAAKVRKRIAERTSQEGTA